MTEDVKYIVFRSKTIKLTRNKDGFWEDEQGTIYAFSDSADSADPIVRCGVGVFSLPLDDPRNEACAAHDYMYSSPFYQAFHTRAEADHALYLSLKHTSQDTITPSLFYFLARAEGLFFWEEDKTNN